MTKYAGFAGFLKRNQTAASPTGTYTTITQLMTVGPVGSERGLIDVSAHGDNYEDNLVGRFAGRVVDVTLLHDPADAQHLAIKTDYDAVTQSVRYYELQHSSWATYAVRFPAIISVWELEMTDDGGAEVHLSFKIVSPGPTVVTPS